MFYVYVLKSKRDNQIYTGFTSDLKRRMSEHNAGLVRSTRSRLPVELIYYEAFKSEKDARNREKYLKGGGRAKTELKNKLKYSLT